MYNLRHFTLRLFRPPLFRRIFLHILHAIRLINNLHNNSNLAASYCLHYGPGSHITYRWYLNILLVYEKPRQNLVSSAINCPNLCYQEKIVNAKADLEADVDMAIEVVEMIDRISSAVLAYTKETWYLAVTTIMKTS